MGLIVGMVFSMVFSAFSGRKAKKRARALQRLRIKQAKRQFKIRKEEAREGLAIARSEAALVRANAQTKIEEQDGIAASSGVVVNAGSAAIVKDVQYSRVAAQSLIGLKNAEKVKDRRIKNAAVARDNIISGGQAQVQAQAATVSAKQDSQVVGLISAVAQEALK